MLTTADPTKPAAAPAAAMVRELPMPREHGGEKAGDIFGSYRLVEPLGEGGFGVVWRAEQTQPVRREVALKLLKRGMDTKQVLARFEQERRVLAAMEHPCIATILDAGVSPDGRPFFVMELLRGLPITTFCEKRELPLRERITLFREVCGGVQHAHQKGVIHRDLKPSNILVTEVDGRPVPKIIDFGIAKALASGDIEAMTLATQANLMLGTPQYMSPEQIGDVGNVDTRSDIYALGTVLYELLAGKPPFAAETLQCKGRQEFWRVIRDKIPQRPSTSYTTKMISVSPSSARAQADVSRLPADLDWITLRALEQEPLRRYQSATEFATDLQRFLDNEPVSAHPPSTAYIASRWIMRHRVVFVAAFVSAFALVVGAGVAIWQAKLARAAQTRAESESVRSRQTANFLTGLLAEVAAEVKMGRNPEALRLALISSQKRIDALGSDPDLQIALMTEVVGLFEGMSDRQLVVPALRQRAEMIAKRHGPDSAEARAAEFNHIEMVVDQGSRIAALELIGTLRNRIEAHEGRGSENWFHAQYLLARVMVKLRRGQEALTVSSATVAEARRRQLEGLRLEAVLMQQVDALEAVRDFTGAEAQLEECRTLAGLQSPAHDLLIEKRLAHVHITRGDHARAADMLAAIVRRMRDQKGDVLYFLLWQADEELLARRLEASITHSQEAFALGRQLSASAAAQGERADTLREQLVKALGIQAAAHSALHHHDQAVPLAHEALLVARQSGNQTVVSRALEAQAHVEESAGHFEAAWEACRQNYELHAAHNASYKNRLDDLREMSRIRLRQQRPADALEHARDAWKQTLAEPSSSLEPDFIAYMAEFALKTWKAANSADPAIIAPAEMDTWEAALHSVPSKSKR